MGERGRHDSTPVAFSDGLMESGFGSPRTAALLTWPATIARMLDVEVALARAQASCGVITDADAEAVSAACRVDRLDLDTLAREAAAAPTPVVPLLAAVRAAGPPAPALHLGATSQDVIDTARMCQLAAVLAMLEDTLRAAVARTAELAEAHRATVLPGRTLTRHAVPTSAGLVFARWHTALARQVYAVARTRREVPTVQFGGVVGTLGRLGPEALAVHDALAVELGLAVPDGPWHPQRDRIVALAGTLFAVLEVVGKVAGDLVRGGATEVGEFEVDAGSGPGSSALPHKRNPVDAVAVRAAVRVASGHLQALLPPSDGEFDRAAGAWQAEWVALPAALVATSGAAERLADTLDRLHVDVARGRANLTLSAGFHAVESLTAALEAEVGTAEAARHVARIVGRAGAGVAGGSQTADQPRADATDAARADAVAAAARADVEVTRILDAEALEAALDPMASLQHVDELIDRALAAAARDVAAAGGPRDAVVAEELRVTTDDGVQLQVRIDRPAMPDVDARSTPGLVPVVFANSLGSDLRSWDPVVARLAPTRPVIRYDTRGHGRSSTGTGSPSIERLGADLCAVLAATDTPVADLCGLSLGGLTAQWVAHALPDRVRRLILVDTAARVGTEEGWRDRANQVRAHGMAPIVPAVLERFFAPAALARGGPEVQAARETLAATDPTGYAACCDALATADLRSVLPTIEAPTLVLVGSADVATPISDAQALVAGLRDARLEVLDGVGHLAPIEAPGAVAAAIAAFLPLTRDGDQSGAD